MKQRPIKFKVWDVENKKFRNNTNLTGGSIQNFVWEFEDEESIYLQFTGLLDKNGKEIYEGDILKESKSGTCSVEWDCAAFCLRAISGSCLSSRNLVSAIFNECDGLDCEVIGNIFENPDLLNNEPQTN